METLDRLDQLIFLELEEFQLTACKHDIQKKMEPLDRLDQLILLELEDEESMGDEIDASEGIQSTLRESIIEIEIMLEKSKKTREPVVPASTSQSQQQGAVSRSKVKLPKLQLRRFHGDPKEYKAISFEVSVNKDSTLSNIEKCTYLQSVLWRCIEASYSV